MTYKVSRGTLSLYSFIYLEWKFWKFQGEDASTVMPIRCRERLEPPTATNRFDAALVRLLWPLARFQSGDTGDITYNSWIRHCDKPINRTD